MKKQTWAIVPVKQFSAAKSRLRAALDGERRGELARVMAADVLRALTDAPSVDRVLVLGQEDAQARLAAAFGAEYVTDTPGLSVTENLTRTAQTLAGRGVDTVLIVPADLPALQPADVERLLAAHAGGVTICVAERDGGTNALVATPPDVIELQFGDDSAQKHASAATAADAAWRFADVPAFRRDIDVAADFDRLIASGAGVATQRWLRNAAIGRPVPGALPDRQACLEIADRPLADLMQSAAAMRDEGHGDIVTYSPKVFIPLTELCRDVCHYCTYAKTPRRVDQAYLTPERVLEIATAGRDAGCREALFTLGDKPELRYRAAREALAGLGYETTLEYVAAMAELVQRETGLLPHLNAGVLSPADYDALRPVAPSMGLMLESASERLCARGMPHFGSPDKQPAVRLDAIRAAGEMHVPFTSGILIGIGETRAERIDSLLALRALHAQYGHIQELIIQNFVPKPGTKMAAAPPPSRDELLWTIAVARHIFGPAMSVQAPPNLNAHCPGELIEAGINDWGGVSPVTPDHVNPESPWPHLDVLRAVTADAGKVLVPRLTVYPHYIEERARWIDRGLQGVALRSADGAGRARDDGPGRPWAVGAGEPPPWRLADSPQSRRPLPRLDTILARAADGERLAADDIIHLFDARGDGFRRVCDAADAMRRRVAGDEVTYAVNRNINYTNVCLYKCRFCAFSKGSTAEELRGTPYVVDLDEVARRTAEAWDRGATEVCLQGGIHPAFTGQTYLDVCRAAKEAAPDIHIHAFSPLEVTHGAQTLGITIERFLERLKSAGLGTLPGTAAEILDDEVRRFICPDKLMTDDWLQVIGTAHAVGLPTTSTIMFGHMETYAHWARHLLALRDLQARTGGITEFVPLPYVHMEAPMHRRGYSRSGPTWRECLLMHAVARLVFHPLIDNIQVSWVKLGPDGAADCLNAGANDLGGTLMNESISRAAGASFGQEFAPDEMDRLIASLGRTPRPRTTLYRDCPPERMSVARRARPLVPVRSHNAREFATNPGLLSAADPRVALSPW